MGFFKGTEWLQSIVDVREFPRVSPLPGAPIKIQIMGQYSIDFTNAKDISVTGIGINVPYEFESCDLNSDVELVITLPGERSFSAVGTLRHRSKCDDQGFFGIEFTAISEASRTLIEKYIAEIQQSQEP